MIGSERISVRLGALRQDWQKLCNALGFSESDGLRQLVASALNRKGVSEKLRASDETRDEPLTRIEFRLSKKAHKVAQKHAKAAGIPTVSRWAKHLVLSNISHEPRLNQKEIDALIDSTVQLQAIGRNLNQLTRDKNAGHEIQDYRFGVIDRLQNDIKSHIQMVTGILAANLERKNRP